MMENERNLIGACFAKNLRAHRKRAGISQEELAFRSSVHRTEIGLLEGGSRTPHIDTAFKIAVSLSIGLDELLKGITWKPGPSRYEKGEFKVEGEQ